MNCPSCGKKILDDSKFCRHCGFKIQHEEDSNKEQNTIDETQKGKHTSANTFLNYGIGILIIVLIILTGIVIKKAFFNTAVDNSDSDSYEYVEPLQEATAVPIVTTTSKPIFATPHPSFTVPNISTADFTENEAFTVAESVVKQKLLSPSTAKFCKFTDAVCHYDYYEDRWTVTGWVDSQNSFGSMIRQNFTAVFQPVRKNGTIGCQHGTVTFS